MFYIHLVVALGFEPLGVSLGDHTSACGPWALTWITTLKGGGLWLTITQKYKKSGGSEFEFELS